MHFLGAPILSFISKERMKIGEPNISKDITSPKY